MDEITNPHDLYFKSTFGEVEFAKDFLNNYLPEELIEVINIDTISQEPNTYLTKELKEQFADLIYKVNIKGKKAYISFLFEHKSYKDRLVIFQVLKYMIALWEKKIKDDIENKDLKIKEIEIPIIIPIIVYHGKYEWTIKESLGEMIPDFMKLPETIKEYIPNLKYLLIDIGKLKETEIANLKKEHGIVLESLSKVRYETKEKVIEIFKKAIDIYTKTKDKDMINHYTMVTIVYIINTRDDLDKTELIEIANQISEEGGDVIMTLAERLRQEGRLEGRLEGIEKGILQGMEKGRLEGLRRGQKEERQRLAKKLLSDGLDIKLISKYTELSEEEIKKLNKEI